jgi:hypothetical protein
MNSRLLILFFYMSFALLIIPSSAIAGKVIEAVKISDETANDEVKTVEDANPSTQDKETLPKETVPFEEEIKGTAEELTRVLMENVKVFLEKELDQLKVKQYQSKQAQEALISGYLSDIKNNPEDASAHFSLGEIYDNYEKGADAILHTRLAEKYYLKNKDIKGIAESRRNLREFYDRYGFKPEDFKLD